MLVYSCRCPKILLAHSSPLSLPIASLGTLGCEETTGYKLFCCLAFCLRWSINSQRLGGGDENLFLSLPCPISLQRHWSPPSGRSVHLVIYFLFLLYLPMLEVGQMSQDPLPYPPQMRNGGPPLAHLSSSMDAHINPSGWLKFKCSQPPLRALDWVYNK